MSGMRMRRGWMVLGASTATRIALAVLYATFVTVALESQPATLMYQLLFLQGGLIALLSASAYARAAHLASQEADLSGSLGSYLRFIAIGSAGALAAGAVLVRADEVGLGERLVVLSLMIVGAACAGLNGLVQGITVVERGPALAWAPTLAVSACACLAMAWLWGPQPFVVVVAVWVVPQVLAPAVLLFANRDLRVLLRGMRGHHDTSSHFAGTGILNASSVAAAYAFRENWAGAQTDEQAATGFFVVRLTEIPYQLIYVALASLPKQVKSFVEGALSSNRTVWLTGAALALASVAGIAPALLVDDWSLTVFLVAEAAVTPARIASILLMLHLLGRPSARAYQVAISLGILASLVLMTIPSIQNSPYGLQAFQAVGTMAPFFVVVVARRRHRRESESHVEI